MREPPPEQKTLSEFCEPFFLAVGDAIRYPEFKQVDARAVRDRLKAELDELRRNASEESARLAADFARILPVLAYFADDMIDSSTLPFAADWRGEMLLAGEPWIGGVADGKPRFFLELDSALREGSPAEERLAIFQTCLGLGFGGIYRENQAKLREYSEQILRHLETVRDKICPESEERIQPDVICQPIAEKIGAIAAICGALLLGTLITYVSIQWRARSQIREVLDNITTRADAAK